MSIGLQHVELEKEPFASSKKKKAFVPTSGIRKEEMVCRAKQLGMKMTCNKNYSVPKCVEWLEKIVPHSDADKSFLKKEIKRFLLNKVFPLK